MTTANDDSRTPIAADKHRATANHKGGSNVLLKGGQVIFMDKETLDGEKDQDARRFRKELVGFGAS